MTWDQLIHPDPQVAGCVALGFLLSLFVLAVVTLAKLPGQGERESLRLLAEQSLAGQRDESERLAGTVVSSERALASRIEETRLAMEQRLGELTTHLARDQGENRVLMEAKLREMAEHTTQRLTDIQRSVNEQLQQAVERQMAASFQRVIDQFTAVQKAMVDVQAVTAQIGDLKRIFSNVKSRGAWGETQLKALLDDLLPEGGYVTNARLREHGAEVVEFAVRMPVRGDARPLLPIDAKFPTSDYERLLAANDAADAEGERAARRALEVRFRLEARKISEKYIVPPRTVEFAVMYLPTDGLYAEAARIPGLIDELGQRLHVMVMGPGLLPALLRTVQLGYVTLALEQKAGQIADLLGATKREMLTMDDVLEKLSRTAGTMTRTIEDARRRTRSVGRKLKDMETMRPDHAEALLELSPANMDDAAE
jgi:DNA recombination protein RmuC